MLQYIIYRSKCSEYKSARGELCRYQLQKKTIVTNSFAFDIPKKKIPQNPHVSQFKLKMYQCDKLHFVKLTRFSALPQSRIYSKSQKLRPSLSLSHIHVLCNEFEGLNLHTWVIRVAIGKKKRHLHSNCMSINRPSNSLNRCGPVVTTPNR